MASPSRVRKERSLGENNFTSLIHRLSKAGFKKEFARSAIFPDWWDDSCLQDPQLLQDLEIRIARFLNQPLRIIRDAHTPLVAPRYPQAQLRRVRDVDRDRLGPAIHSAMRIAGAVIRNLKSNVPEPDPPPADGLIWRRSISPDGRAVTLHDIVADLWNRGIPVIPLELLPMPSFQGIAGIVEDRPVILLGYKHDEPGRVAFFVSHEAGHIAAGDCVPDQPVVDEDEDVVDNSLIERRANRYATHVLMGSDTTPKIQATAFKDLARQANEIESREGVDATRIILDWARRHGNYQTATLALKALYRATGARKKLRQLFEQHVDIEAANDTDRALLRCVCGEPESD